MSEEIKKEEATTINVDTSKEEHLEEDKVSEQILADKQDEVKLSKRKRKITKKQKDALAKKAEETEINWDEIEFEDEGKNYPKVTREDLEIFNAISSEFIGMDTLEDYLLMAKEDIDQYLELKALKDSGNFDKDDEKYFNSLEKSKEEAKKILALIQIEGKKLAKEFKDSNIAEDTVKTVSFGVLHDFIIKTFRYLDLKREKVDNQRLSDKELHELFKKIDRSKKINKKIAENMYVLPIFSNYFLQDKYLLQNSFKNNIFYKENYEKRYDYLLNSLYAFKHALIEKGQFDIGKILQNDFKAFDFTRIPIICGNFCYNKENVFEKSIDEKNLKYMQDILCNSSDEHDKLKDIADLTNKICTKLIDKKKLNKIIDVLRFNIKTNHLYKEHFESINKEEFENFVEFSFKIIEKTPDKNESSIKVWGKWYVLLKEYERWYIFFSLNKKIEEINASDAENKEVLCKREAFIVFTVLLEEYFNMIYGHFIDELISFIRYDRSFNQKNGHMVFGIIMNSLILQHQLGFKTQFEFSDGETEGNDHGDKLYDLAEKVFLKEQYKYMVGKRENDRLLKDVNLYTTRQNYIVETKNILTNIDKFISSLLSETEEFTKPRVIAKLNRSTKKLSRAQRKKNKALAVKR